MTDSISDALARMNNYLAESRITPHLSSGANLERPIVYIIGAPRSGTTLAHQLLARCLTLDYIDQISARFWLAPSLGMALSRDVMGDRRPERISFESELGVSFGPEGPHEFGFFWNHWMGFKHSKTHKLTAEETAAVDLEGLKTALESELLAVSREGGLLLKNLTCGLQARLLCSLHANSLFVYLDRPPLDVARSLLYWRIQRNRDVDEWLSLKPSSFPRLSLVDDPVVQVIHQVLDSKREIEDEITDPTVRTLRVTFRELLQEPNDVVTRVATSLAATGASVDIRREFLPGRFHSPPRPELPKEIEARLMDKAGHLT